MDKEYNFGCYFEIKDGEVFGGKGSIGYVAFSIEADGSFEEYKKFEEASRKYVAGMMGVPEDAVISILESEYIKNTEEEE